MTAITIAVLIFFLRIADVSLGTVRVIYTIRGNRTVSAALGLLEAGIWIFAISQAIIYVDNPLSMFAWAAGFAAGNVAGITLEQWIATGSILMRIISAERSADLREALLGREVGVTALPGEGRNRPVQILFIVAPRRRGKELLRVVQEIDPKAFITIDPVSRAIGGYLPVVTAPTSMRK